MQIFSHGLSRGGPGLPDWSFGRDDSGFSVAAAHRAGLGRGLAFVLLLASSVLASFYIPQALHGSDWTEDPAPSSFAVVR